MRPRMVDYPQSGLICDLDMHCGECKLIEFCCEDGYAICTDPRLEQMDITLYKEHAKTAEVTTPGFCVDCTDACDVCDRYSEYLEVLATQFSNHVLIRLGRNDEVC